MTFHCIRSRLCLRTFHPKARAQPSTKPCSEKTPTYLVAENWIEEQGFKLTSIYYCERKMGLRWWRDVLIPNQTERYLDHR
jgi:hypothetical protein